MVVGIRRVEVEVVVRRARTLWSRALCGGASYFVHQSAKDFLLNNAAQEIFSAGREVVHHTIFARSLQIMSSTLKRDIYGLKALGTSIKDVTTPTPDPLAALRYSCVHWIDHLCDLKPTTSGTYAEFLQDGGVVDDVLLRKKVSVLARVCEPL